ncbi:hypothetical protein [Bordetella genomosp. 4]|uniref:Uncharacterized protein n=1 Tax=Bordetella genomosp. 4 TaxID=463044 RepID=A0A261U6Z7_9BORD|nr:hypothetical protein [Bordetella genomosp. 4]OZI57679.1 hypothetical protein CAL20_09905 [Bordetella genomosp. 4]
MKRRMEIYNFEVSSMEGKFGARSIPTQNELSIASIPDVNGDPAGLTWIDPDEKWYVPTGTVREGAWRCRADGAYWVRDPDAEGGSSASIQPGMGINGTPSIDFDGTSGLSVLTTDEHFYTLPNNEFTLLIVASMTVGAQLISTYFNNSISNSLLYVSGTSGNLVSPHGGSGVIQAPGSFTNGVPFLAAVTFSTTGGMTLRRNGVQVARDVTRTTPRAGLRPKIGRQQYSAAFSGSIGRVHIEGVDMSRPEYATMLAFLENDIMTASNITPGS